jgi:hypothetical protein
MQPEFEVIRLDFPSEAAHRDLITLRVPLGIPYAPAGRFGVSLDEAWLTSRVNG